MKLFRQTLLLALPFLLAIIWQNTFLSGYTIQVIALLIVVYLVLTIRRRGQSEAVFFGGSVDVFIFITIILLLVLSTKDFQSGFFFLLYFLCFGISFVFEPLMVFLFVIYLIALFFILNLVFVNDPTSNLIRLGSFVLLAPLAFFFGRELKKEEKQEAELTALKERSVDSANTIAKDVKEIVEHEKATLKEEDVARLDEVLEETETLREEKSEEKA